nr:M14 family metallopeptidase [uncultured Merdimonas sp.]
MMTIISQFREKIYYPSDMTKEQKKISVELARVLGFQCEAAEFPVTDHNSGIKVPESLEELEKYRPEVPEVQIPEDYVASSDTARPMPDFDWRRKRGLETLFSRGELLQDQNLDQLPDTMDLHFVIPEDADDFVYEAACNLAFRFGMETTAYEGLLLDKDMEGGNRIIFEGGKDCNVSWEEDGGILVKISGQGQQLLDFVSELCGHFPMQGAFDTWTDRLKEIGSGFRMRSLDGQLAYAKAYADQGAEAYVEPAVKSCLGRLEKEFPAVRFFNYKDEKKEYEVEYDICWEVDDLKKVLEQKVYGNLRTGNQVCLQIAVSEDQKVRKSLEAEIRERLRQLGIQNPEVTVLCSYKQGFSWISEKEIPELKKYPDLKTVEIYFKPFLPPGVTEWKDEDGAVPSYSNIDKDPERWYDMPIRYLQELYPIEDVIAKETGIDPDQIVFKVYEGAEDITYELKGLGTDGRELYHSIYKAAWTERCYIDAYPDLGKVHPATGYVRLSVDGEKLLDEQIESDVEKIWKIYQQQVLPDIREYVDKKTRGKDLVSAQPFFEKLEIDILASEPDERLDSREDLLSSLDGLHEDIYFVGTDYFKNYGMEKAGQVTDAPGLILPKIRKQEGKPRMKVTVYAQNSQEPVIRQKDGSLIRPVLSKSEVNVWMKGFHTDEEGNTAVLRVEGVPEEVVKAYAELLDKDQLMLGSKLEGIRKLVFETEQGSYTARIREKHENKESLDIRQIDLSEDRLIGYEDYIRIIDQLKKVPELNVYPVAVSYKGRTVYAVEFCPRLSGYISRTKRITAHPSQIIDSRHHANEVSSTNSAFMLIRKILTDEAFTLLPDQMNLVILPMENVDGAAIHYELQKDNPNWKLHVARFNAVGKEFYYDLFETETIHTEAEAMRRLFMTFLPDALIDNHGVPSHEWEQQFSGYTSPAYKGFWLPRSLLYGYFYHITGDEYHSNYTLNKKMEDVIADAFMEDEEITRENKMWARQFEKYAHAWMPKMFPADYYKNMINYWIPHEYDPTHRYPSIRYPWILSLDYVSEVADETAQGAYLHSCARAHTVHDVAILKSMMQADCVYTQEWEMKEQQVKVVLTRKRPIII